MFMTVVGLWMNYIFFIIIIICAKWMGFKLGMLGNIMGLITFMRICYEMYCYFLMMLSDCCFDALSNICEFFKDLIVLLLLGITCL
jgi:hypothetical protein